MLPESFKEDCFAAMLEFVGTTVFLLFGLGSIQAVTEEAAATASSSSNIERVLYISSGMGFSLLVSAWLFYRVTGSLFNPNVSLALLIVGVITPVRFVLYCIAQLLGAIAASALVIALIPGSLSVNAMLQPGVNAAQGVFIEMFITAALVLSVLMLAVEKHNTTPFAPIGVGLTLFACHLFAVNYTGAAMNTARAFGPAATTGFPNGYHWVYWIGPFLGSILASGFYSIIKHYHYWKLNPNQETVENHMSPPDPIERAREAIVSFSQGNGDASPTGSGGGREDSRLRECEDNWRMSEKNDSPV